MARKVVLVDAKNMCYRMHFIHSRLSSKGRPTSVLHGFLMGMVAIARKMPNTPIWLVWDSRGKTWRHQMMAARVKEKREQLKSEPEQTKEKFEGSGHSKGYKGTRTHMADSRAQVQQQIPTLRTFLSDFGFRSVSIKNLEADDLIGILSHSLLKQTKAERVIIYSSDKDFIQLLSDNVWLWKPTRGEHEPTFISPGSVERRFGVKFEDWLRLRALVGDKSDNIPHLIKGLGPVGARKLLASGLDPSKPNFGDMPKNVQQIHKGLSEMWGQVHENYVLLKIVRKLNHPLLPEEVKSDIGTFLDKINDSYLYRDRQSTTDGMFKKFCNFLFEYELEEVLHNKWDLWRIP
jgi:5'-3' exonuclease